MASIGQAPGELARLQAFVNTLDIEQATDELSTPADLDRWLQAAGLAAAEPRAAARDESGPGELALALELREALRDVLGSHVTHPPAPGQSASAPPGATAPAAPAGDAAAPAPLAGAAAPAALADALAGAAARLGRIAGAADARIVARPDGSVGLESAGAGSRAALSRLLLIAAEAATLGTWIRLKACSADDCRWAFYDRSPTRSGCWCSMQGCGSKAKSRAYRRRSARTG